MKQIYVPFYKWECYKAGMWNTVNKETEITMLNDAIEFTGDHVVYGDQMRLVVYKWPNTMKNHLTNKGINRRAFLGHCAVYYKLQIPEYIVRMAWKKLTDKQRRFADYEAEKTIKDWELWYMKKLENTLINGKDAVIKKEYQMKLPFN